MNVGQIIKLNGRRYRLLDIGEGHCHIAIVDDAKSYASALALDKPRLLVVDVSIAILTVDSHLERAKMIADDIHLLLDVFWLDEVSISCHAVKYVQRYLIQMLAKRDYARELQQK